MQKTIFDFNLSDLTRFPVETRLWEGPGVVPELSDPDEKARLQDVYECTMSPCTPAARGRDDEFIGNFFTHVVAATGGLRSLVVSPSPTAEVLTLLWQELYWSKHVHMLSVH